MKELEKQDRVEKHEEKQQEQQYRLLGDMLKKPGLTLYEYDPINKVLNKAQLKEKIKEVEVVLEPKAPKVKEKIPKGHVMHPEYMIRQHAENQKKTVANVLFKPGHDYFYALNDKSAAKKLYNMIRRGLIRQ